MSYRPWLSGLVALFAASSLTGAAQAEKRHKEAKPREPLPFALDAYPSTYSPLPRVDTLIRNATVLDGLGARLDDTDVLMAGGKIVSVGRDLAPPDGATVIDASGHWLTPGVIDVHSHNGTFVAPLTSQDWEASDVTESTDPNTSHTSVLHAVNVQDPAFSRALAGGVTTLQVLPGSTVLFSGRAAVLKPIPAVTAQAMRFPGAPAAMKMACGENPKGHFAESGRFPASRMGEVAGMREQWLKARKHRNEWEAYERGDKKDPPDRDLKLETLSAALRGEVRVHLHCYRSDDIATMLSLAREFGYRIAAVHHASEAYKIAGLLRDEGVCAAVWPDWWGFKMEVGDAIRENAAFLDAAGACVMMHSDSPQVGQRLNIEAAKAMGAGRRAGLDIRPEQAVRWFTSNPAKALGMEDRIGSLAPGRNADVVVWSGDPFSIYTKADQVFIDGALVYDRADPGRRPRSDFEVGRPNASPRP
ncbi:amidohydrolase [Phenylobacterium sp.]|uniref:amidohydrolase n=1 Tax=Phenylobacterium sp. TaxID=1871053 RepID=UPI002FC5B59F